MREIRTSSLMSGDGRRTAHAAPRPSSTLPIDACWPALYLPAAFALAMPSRWRSSMISRSHVATPGQDGQHQLAGGFAGIQLPAAHAQDDQADAALGQLPLDPPEAHAGLAQQLGMTAANYGGEGGCGRIEERPARHWSNAPTPVTTPRGQNRSRARRV